MASYSKRLPGVIGACLILTGTVAFATSARQGFSGGFDFVTTECVAAIGVYAFIEAYLKVDPLYFWSGREPVKRSELKWNTVSLVSGTPSLCSPITRRAGSGGPGQEGTTMKSLPSERIARSGKSL